MLSNDKKKMANQLINLSKQAKRKLVNKATHAENKFRKYLSDLNINYEFQKIIYLKDKENNVTDFYIADFYVAYYNMIIELDGDYHDNEDQIEKDIERDEMLNSMGYKILRINNLAVYNNKALYDIIKRFIKDNDLKKNSTDMN